MNFLHRLEPRLANPLFLIQQPTRGVFRKHWRLVIFFALLFSTALLAQESSTENASQIPPAAPQASATPEPRLKRSEVITVTSSVSDGYIEPAVQVGVAGTIPLLDAPMAVTAVPRQLLDDKQSRLLSDVLKNDASAGENYAPEGFYGDYAIRGFVLDLATALKFNNLTIAGEQDVPLEGIERVEFLKGLSGLESGVAAPGGIINFVSKRPANIRSVTVGTDARAGFYGSADVGSIFGSRQQYGLRLNFGGENIHSYVHGADGTREFITTDFDWRPDNRSLLKVDFTYQHKVQRSVSGYQLLGGTKVPDHVSPSVMLGEQWWVKPNTFDTYNFTVRYEKNFARNWQAYASAIRSQSLIDDNVAYVYGSTVNGIWSNNFSSAGDYDVYDYRSPNERRVAEQLDLGVLGKFRTSIFTHNISTGISGFRRLVSLMDSVYAPIGAENIYQPLEPLPPSNDYPSNYYRRLNSNQYSYFVTDRIDWGTHWRATAGGREVVLHDHSYDRATATDPISITPHNQTVWLPQYSLVYKPISSISVYGSYSQSLSLGQQAPWWVTVNGDQFLAPVYNRQIEVGAKYDFSQKLQITTAVFRLRTPFQYTKFDASGASEFVAEGRETHDGIEFGATGKLSSSLAIFESAAALKAEETGSSILQYDNRQLPNIPHFRNSLSVDYGLPGVSSLHLLPGWYFTGRKSAALGGVASVPSYSLFNLGARYQPSFNKNLVLNAYCENLLNKVYWKDTGFAYGDTFLHLGAPRSLRLAAKYSF